MDGAGFERGWGIEMETAQLPSHPPGRVRRWVWNPVRKAAQLMSYLQEAAVNLACQVREVATLVLHTLDGITLRTTRVRARSQIEWVVGPLTFSIAGGVIFARAGNSFPE